MRVLFLSNWFPYPATNGSKLRIYNLLRVLAPHHEVTLISFADRPDADPAAPVLRALCCDIQIVPWTPFDPWGGHALRGLLSRVPRSMVDTFSPAMARRIDTILAAGRINLVVASQVGTASYAPYFCDTPALFEEVELGVLYDRFKRAPTAGQRARYGLTWLKHRRYLYRLLPHFRACTVVSETERRLLATAVPRAPRTEVIPNAVDGAAAANVTASRDPDGLIFAGSLRYFANHDAMQWFLADVFPQIRVGWPAAHLTVTGDPGDAVLAPNPGVTVTGLLDDVRGAVASASVSVVPIRIGGGTRLKILEAMALGTPVVATSKGAEGLDVVSGEHLLIADDPRQFADHVVRLLHDRALREGLAGRARELVVQRYDWAVVGPRFAALVENVGRPAGPVPTPYEGGG
jgi:glycosyltransferase involved in cell wall biosynthesis